MNDNITREMHAIRRDVEKIKILLAAILEEDKKPERMDIINDPFYEPIF